MTSVCLKCGGPAESRFRPVLGRGRMERLCPHCADELSALVLLAGDTCLLSLTDPRLAAWLETGRWPLPDGQSLGVENLPGGWHRNECPLCAVFMEEE
jgi:hypothetical protein